MKYTDWLIKWLEDYVRPSVKVIVLYFFLLYGYLQPYKRVYSKLIHIKRHMKRMPKIHLAKININQTAYGCPKINFSQKTLRAIFGTSTLL